MPAGAPPAGHTPSGNSGSTPPSEIPPPVVDETKPSTQAAAGASNADDGVGLNDEATKSELRRARDEAAAHRVKLRKFEEAFEGYEDADVEKALTMYRNLLKDPKSARKDFKQTLKNLEAYLTEQGEELDDDDDDTPPAKGAKKPKVDDDDRPLSRKEMLKLLEERDEKKATDQAVKDIISQTVALGYKEGSWQYQAVLYIANKDPNAKGDVKKAHEIFQEEIKANKKAGVDEYLESIGKPRHPPVSSGGKGGAPAGEPPAKKFDAKASALARLTAAGF